MDYNIAVITTMSITNKYSIVKRVVRDIEGDWQFLDGNDVSEQNARVVSLQDILNLDSSLIEILNIPVGSVAIRDDKNKEWILGNLK